MELLDELEVASLRARTFKKVVDVSVRDLNEESSSASEEDEGDYKHNASTKGTVSIDPGMFAGNAVLDRVRRRLNGEPAEEPGTQIIQETQEIETATLQIGTQEGIKETQKVHVVSELSVTQQIGSEKTQQIDSTLVISKEEADDDDEAVPVARIKRKDVVFTDSEGEDETGKVDVTQKIAPDSQKTAPGTQNEKIESESPKPAFSKLFVEDSDDEQENTNEDNADVPNLSKAELREIKIKELAAKKRNERLMQEANEKQTKDLEDELFNDLQKDQQKGRINDLADSEDEDDYDESKEIRHEVHKKKTFDKTVLLQLMKKNKGTAANPKQDAVTSDKNTEESKDDDDVLTKYSQDKLEELKLKDESMQKEYQQKQKPLPKSIINYKQKLQEALSEGGSKKIIVLDSDSDNDEDSSEDESFKVSKTTKLEVKSKFSKKQLQNKVSFKKLASTKQLLSNLSIKNRKQLKKQFGEKDKEHDLKILELQRDQDQVENWLERELENNRKTKEKELRIQQLKEEGKYDSEDEVDEVEDSDEEVPESADEDVISEEEGEDENQSEDQDQGQDQIMDLPTQNTEDEEKIHIRKKNKKAAIDDDDDDDDDSTKAASFNNQNDEVDIGSFGGNFSQFQDSQTSIVMKESPKLNISGDIFQHLRTKNQNQSPLQVDSQPDSTQLTNNDLEDSFKFSVSQNKPEFIDNFTQQSEVQPPSQNFSTQRDSVGAYSDATAEDIEDPEDDLPKKPKQRRLFKKSVMLENVSEGSEGSDEEEETAEQLEERKKQLLLLREKQKAKEKQLKRQKLEMKRKGVDKIFENEAEESEDEWQGIGGADGDLSDEENSEDEKMLDDLNKQKFNQAEINKLIMKEDLLNDERMVHKVLHDIHNGGFRKRGARNELDLDISDEEDDVIRQYNIIKNQRLREKLEQDEKLAKIAKNQKSKAFFQSIAEDSQNSSLDVFKVQEEGLLEEHTDEEENDEDNNEDDDSADKSNEESNSFKKKRRYIMTETSVHSALSFLQEDTNTEYALKEANTRISMFQHGFNDDDDDEGEDDLFALKQKSIINIVERTPERKKHKSATIDLTADDTSPKFYRHSSSVKSFQSLQNDSFKNNNEVTYSTAYKVASSSKASITYMGKTASSSSTKVKSMKNLISSKIAPRVLKVRNSKSNKLKNLSNVNRFE